MMSTDGIPETWPALLSRDQLRAYLGGIGDATLRMILPVAPVDLGANVLRYRKSEVDAWVQALGHRLPKPRDGEQDASPAAFTVVDRPTSAIERARARARG
ncbi:MAG: hypothetical protein JHD15_19400 [Phenylobacterium sp.]|uniref:helix-turn-helix transcriptional regulator n=1 Tax=Phenylobacterium sp. TaxID=1871053 RepID=UPI001A291828|nr:hypothetical protein [Phenylobacterium sp.]MBJ7412505.1 hypothetical protein [Phenylobacterium sp.]